MTFQEYAQTRGYTLRPDPSFPPSWIIERCDNGVLWGQWMSAFHEPDRDMWETIVNLWDADFDLKVAAL